MPEMPTEQGKYDHMQGPSFQPTGQAEMLTSEWVELVQTLGAPLIFAAVCVWFIKYMYDQQLKAQHEFFDRDSRADDKLFLLAEKSNEALSKVSVSLDANTNSMDNLISAITAEPKPRRRT